VLSVSNGSKLPVPSILTNDRTQSGSNPKGRKRLAGLLQDLRDGLAGMDTAGCIRGRKLVPTMVPASGAMKMPQARIDRQQLLRPRAVSVQADMPSTQLALHRSRSIGNFTIRPHTRQIPPRRSPQASSLRPEEKRCSPFPGSPRRLSAMDGRRRCLRRSISRSARPQRADSGARGLCRICIHPLQQEPTWPQGPHAVQAILGARLPP